MRLTELTSGALRQSSREKTPSSKLIMHTFRFFLWLSLSTIFFLSGCSIAPDTTSANDNQPTQVVVRLLNLDVTLAASATPTQEIIPTPVIPTIPPTNTPEAAQPTVTILSAIETPRCTNQAEFLRHISIPEHTSLKAGQSFVKIWQVKNIGTCTWTTDYSLKFFSGDPMNGPPSIPLPNQVLPGEVVDLKIALVVPSGLRTTTGFWVLSDAEGGLFGTSESADQPISVLIDIKPTPWPTPG